MKSFALSLAFVMSSQQLGNGLTIDHPQHAIIGGNNEPVITNKTLHDQ